MALNKGQHKIEGLIKFTRFFNFHYCFSIYLLLLLYSTIISKASASLALISNDKKGNLIAIDNSS